MTYNNTLNSILLCSWSLIPTDDPLENNKHTIFYKTLELAHADEGIKEYFDVWSVAAVKLEANTLRNQLAIV